MERSADRKCAGTEVCSTFSCVNQNACLSYWNLGNYSTVLNFISFGTGFYHNMFDSFIWSLGKDWKQKMRSFWDFYKRYPVGLLRQNQWELERLPLGVDHRFGCYLDAIRQLKRDNVLPFNVKKAKEQFWRLLFNAMNIFAFYPFRCFFEAKKLQSVTLIARVYKILRSQVAYWLLVEKPLHY